MASSESSESKHAAASLSTDATGASKPITTADVQKAMNDACVARDAANAVVKCHKSVLEMIRGVNECIRKNVAVRLECGLVGESWQMFMLWAQGAGFKTKACGFGMAMVSIDDIGGIPVQPITLADIQNSLEKAVAASGEAEAVVKRYQKVLDMVEEVTKAVSEGAAMRFWFNASPEAARLFVKWASGAGYNTATSHQAAECMYLYTLTPKDK
jgi:hypothetical protein